MINEVKKTDLLSALLRPNVNSGGANGFDQLMTDMENRSRDDREPTIESRESRNNDNRRSESNDRRADRAERSQEAPRAERRDDSRPVRRRDVLSSDEAQEFNSNEGDVAATDVEAVSLETLAEPDVQYNYGNSELQDAIVMCLAEAIYVPPKALYELLVNLEMAPEELAEAPVANKLLQNLLKVESPVELLMVPEYKDVLTELTEAVTEVLESATPAEAKPDLQKLAGLVATLDDDGNLVISQDQQVAELNAELNEQTLVMQEEAGQQQLSGGNERRNSDSTAEAATTQEDYAAVVQEAPEVLLAKTGAQAADVSVAPVANIATQAASAVQSVAGVASAARVDPTHVMQQIITQVKSVSAENFAELRMTLRPEHLGDVTMRVAVQNGIVIAMFVAENQRVKEILESNFQQLKDALEEQGIEVSEMFVSVDSESAEEQMNQFLKAQQEAIRRMQRAAGLVSDVEEVAEEENAPIDPSIVLQNTVDFSA